MYKYDREYARKYIEGTLSSPYTVYKNVTIAEIINNLKIDKVWDFGGNVSGLMKVDGSLRFQLAKRNIDYNAVDLTPAYFSSSFAKSLGQPETSIYSNLSAVVGDIRHLPLMSASAEGIVCADVIEHIDYHEQAMSEMYRVLKPGGSAIVVVPSLYKLDAIKIAHILQKRFSSHKNRLLVSDWVELLTKAGFSIDRHNSRPLGIASGLLYTAWSNPDYVPVRSDASAKEEFSEKATQFRNVKSIVSKVDGDIDQMVLNDRNKLEVCQKLFKRGDIVGLLNLVQKWYQEVTSSTSDDLSNFIKTFDVGSVSIDTLDQLVESINTSDKAIRDNAFFGNSALLVLHKSNTL